MPPPSLLDDVDLSEDEDDSPMHQDLENSKANQLKHWDLFQQLPPDEDDDLIEDRTCYLFLLKTLKVIAYILVFVMVLVSTVVAKSTALLMTSQLDKDRYVSHCYETFENAQFLVNNTVEERICWTWTIYFCFIAPEVLVFLRSVRKWVFKGQLMPTRMEFLLPFMFETLHTIGMGLLLYAVLPKLDVVKAVMLTNALCLVPGILGLLSRGYDKYWTLKCVADACAIMFQVTALFVWPFLTQHQSEDRLWILSIAAVLVSFGWWENFVETSSPFELIRRMARMKKHLRASRYVSYAVISVWKMAVMLLVMLCCVWMNEGSFTVAFDTFHTAFMNNNVTITEKRPSVNDMANAQPGTNVTYLNGASRLEETDYRAVQYAMIAQMCSAFVAFIFAKFACKIKIQSFSFAFPILLAVPVTMIALVNLCGMREKDVCFMKELMPGYLFWTCPAGNFWTDFLFGKQHAWVWILWILSQTWIGIHIWNPKGKRLAITESMFTTPYYNAILIDQSVALNRRRDEDIVEVDGEDEESGQPEYEYVPLTGLRANDDNPNKVSPSDTVPRIYACATMWHETREEMIEMLKSVYRMDADQCARRVALKYFEYKDPGYYEFETHIFFDDAFEFADPSKPGASHMQINSFVRTLVGSLEEAASHVHQAFVKLRRPKKIPTPYGGRLEWVLPGKTKFIVHIKDKLKIRHKKRWSQVMYMYYLLGHLLMDQPISTARKEVIAENTFLLALDGDIDFQPNAVELLVDLMKKNKQLGAACGRLLPMGTGPMVWFQKFEYSIGHWLQKAAEHVFGCVLCSPGCFSLFRGKALMDDNVMAKYTTTATEPKHYVQFDQGEDRWLCTLLLQRGWRIEYCAAADAKTFAPESFNEFYNQRRRWTPSTMANIMDLLMNSRKVVKANPDITSVYIFYQMIMMIGGVLGPGTIFLMMVGAFATGFRLDQWSSFLYNFIPILGFILICYFCKSDIQLTVAQILSVVYALVMVAVLVAIVLQIAEDGPFAPQTLFLLAVAFSFIIAAIVHPTEFWNLGHGLVYYITIPSMYLLLTIYSLFNLHVVSWGTRETPQTKTAEQLEAEQKAAEEMSKKKKKGLLFGLIPSQRDQKESEGSFELSFAGLFKLMCCVKDKPDQAKIQLDHIAAALDRVAHRLDSMERSLDSTVTPSPSISSAFNRKSSTTNSGGSKGAGGAGALMDSILEGDEKSTSSEEESSLEAKIQRDDLMNPYWIEDKDLRKAEVDFLTGREIEFWQDMIEKYLKPLDADKKKEGEMAAKLKQLRNNVIFAFCMINAVFVILIFLLQLEKDLIHVKWPFASDTNVTYVPFSTQVDISVEYLELEPIGLVFIVFFGIILVLQFTGMLIHRFGTLSHILSATDVTWCSKDTKTVTKEHALRKHGVGLIRRLQQAKAAGGDETEEKKRKKSVHDLAGRRKTIANLERQKTKKKEVGNLEVNFRRNFTSFSVTSERRGTKLFTDEKSRTIFNALKERRSTVLGRRSSVVSRRQSLFDGSGSISGGNNTITDENRLFKRYNPRQTITSPRPRAPAPEPEPEQFEMTSTT